MDMTHSSSDMSEQYMGGVCDKPPCDHLSLSSSLPPFLLSSALLSLTLSIFKVTLLSFKVESEYTFVDFIRGG